MTLEHRHRSCVARGRQVSMKSAVDILALGVSLLSLLFTLDQVRLIWIMKSASGVSVISWGFYTLSALIWLFYGVLHKDKIITITNFLWVMFSLCIVIGALLYQ